MKKLAGVTLRSITSTLSNRTHFAKSLATAALTDADYKENSNNSNGKGTNESNDEFEKRIFGGIFGSGNNQASESFFQKLDRLEKARNRPPPSSGAANEGNSSILDGLDEGFNSLNDGLDGKLKRAATYFEFDPEEVMREDYSFRPDMSFRPGSTYELKDLDLEKPAVRKFSKKNEFTVTTKEALEKADFRNVRFLANFLTEAGILYKRSMTGISAKAQRRIAREIKTARAFGLLPFTTMGTKSFIFGQTMENLPEDYEYQTFGPRTPAGAGDEVEADPLET
ncbi:uncharacterized protein LOC126659516 [Mercurialis annua]|uniref:uncharacterized protein LOC126659516 n=1 Tax=Mercurialis annua TaxID=3986 RepID=UPI00215FE66D|nr:uncharacterized protein LOC126659516 [Mercurialis annua]